MTRSPASPEPDPVRGLAPPWCALARALARARHLAALGGLFVQVLALCGEPGLVKLGHIAIDGTKVLRKLAAAG